MRVGVKERRVVAYNGHGEIKVLVEEVPEIGVSTVLVDVKACLVSPGTELMGNVCGQRQNPDAKQGYQKFGYGNAGVVMAVGREVKGIEVGDRVACMGGQACHSSHVVVPQNLCCLIPEGLSFEEAAFAHLAATGLHAVRRSKVEFGQSYAVMGLGLVGNLAAQFAKLSGAHVIGMDGVDMRLHVAQACGVDIAINPFTSNVEEVTQTLSKGHGIDTGLIAFGGDATKAVQQLVSLMKVSPDTHVNGSIVIVGGATFTGQFPVPFGNMDIRSSSRPGPGYHDDAWEHGRDYPEVFVQWTSKRNLEESLRSAAEGKLQLSKLITHRIALDDAADGCEKLISAPNEALGVILIP